MASVRRATLAVEDDRVGRIDRLDEDIDRLAEDHVPGDGAQRGFGSAMGPHGLVHLRDRVERKIEDRQALGQSHEAVSVPGVEEGRAHRPEVMVAAHDRSPPAGGST